MIQFIVFSSRIGEFIDQTDLSHYVLMPLLVRSFYLSAHVFVSGLKDCRENLTEIWAGVDKLSGEGVKNTEKICIEVKYGLKFDRKSLGATTKANWFFIIREFLNDSWWNITLLWSRINKCFSAQVHALNRSSEKESMDIKMIFKRPKIYHDYHWIFISNQLWKWSGKWQS